jgi:hypothetical protein
VCAWRPRRPGGGGGGGGRWLRQRMHGEPYTTHKQTNTHSDKQINAQTIKDEHGGQTKKNQNNIMSREPNDAIHKAIQRHEAIAPLLTALTKELSSDEMVAAVNQQVRLSSSSSS